jgi:hypothetical protein
MTRWFAICLAALMPVIAASQEAETATPVATILPAGDLEPDAFLWTNRLVVVFADTPADPRFGEQIEKLMSDMDALAERDIVVLTDTDPDARAPIRTKLRPRGFQVTLVGKDGGVKLRKPAPITVRELSRTIDKMPVRQREIRERRGDG